MLFPTRQNTSFLFVLMYWLVNMIDCVCEVLSMSPLQTNSQFVCLLSVKIVMDIKLMSTRTATKAMMLTINIFEDNCSGNRLTISR